MIFTYKNWEKISRELSEKFYTIRADEILENIDAENWLVVKHDVETNVAKALELAKIEHRYNIKATYYIQADLLEENKEKLQEIAALGHEIAYHYDVLDANDGNYEAAIKEFQKHLDTFRSLGFTIKTVCPHGNPIKIRDGWSSNKDFFKNDRVNATFPDILDIVVHLPKIVKKEYAYISDAGYSFKKIANIYDNDRKDFGDTKKGRYSENNAFGSVNKARRD